MRINRLLFAVQYLFLRGGFVIPIETYGTESNLCLTSGWPAQSDSTRASGLSPTAPVLGDCPHRVAVNIVTNTTVLSQGL